MSMQILAMSPAFGGPGTRPYRVVLRSDDSKGPVEFCTHFMFLDNGTFIQGTYHREDYTEAMRRWMERTEEEINVRDERCWIFNEVKLESKG